jgi:hypothetical protein
MLRFSGISIRSALSFVRLGGEVTAPIARRLL